MEFQLIYRKDLPKTYQKQFLILRNMVSDIVIEKSYIDIFRDPLNVYDIISFYKYGMFFTDNIRTFEGWTIC